MRFMSDRSDELLNVYDAAGALVGTRPRREAKSSGLAVGAINVLLVNSAGEVLLQLRVEDKENGGLWDKSVGGHVSAGEDFDATALRETGEELFGGNGASCVALVADEPALHAAEQRLDLGAQVAFFRAGVQANLRDVRIAPGGGQRNVLYHVAIYLGRTDVPVARLSPQASEISELRYFTPEQVDALLLDGRLAPNMAYLWLAYGQRALGLARGRA